MTLLAELAELARWLENSPTECKSEAASPALIAFYERTPPEPVSALHRLQQVCEMVAVTRVTSSELLLLGQQCCLREAIAHSLVE